MKVRRDASGAVRQFVELLGVGPAPLTPRALAEQYLRDAAPIFGFTAAEMANFAAETAPSATNAGTELRFKEEKAVGNGVTVSYDQTVYGLPIWDAGVVVRIDGKAMGVTSAHNAAHYAVQAQRPGAGAAYLPHMMDMDKVRRLLGLKPTDPALTINGTRALVLPTPSWRARRRGEVMRRIRRRVRIRKTRMRFLDPAITAQTPRRSLERVVGVAIAFAPGCTLHSAACTVWCAVPANPAIF